MILKWFHHYDPTDTSDLFDLISDLNDPLEPYSYPPSPAPSNMYPPQVRMTYSPQVRPQMLPNYPQQTNMIRPINGLQQQQQTTMYTPTRSVYPRINVPQQVSTAPGTTMIRSTYNSSGMMNMNPNVQQMNLVKNNDPNNNHVFHSNPSSQQTTTTTTTSASTTAATVRNVWCSIRSTYSDTDW